QSASIEIVRSQNKSFLRRQVSQSLVSRVFYSGIDHADGFGIAGGKLGSVFAFFVETDEPFLTAITIYMFLRQHCAQPAFERPASCIGRQLRCALAVASDRAIKIGVAPIREVAGSGGSAPDVQRDFVQAPAIAAAEGLRRS